MVSVEIPGTGAIELEYLLLDYNGTLALDGNLIATVTERLLKLSQSLKIIVLTADTFGLVRVMCESLPLEIRIVDPLEGGLEKGRIVKELGPDRVVAIGNGYNDRLMLKECVLGILIIGDEGCSIETMQNADVAVKNIETALDLLIYPKRLIATLRA
ncbi:MAG: ATPase P [Firmicutes bacterium]|nr:ATPase P [Bacillota bacterium]